MASELLGVVGIELEGLVDLLLAVVGVVAGSALCGTVQGLFCSGGHIDRSVGRRIVDTEVQVEVKVLEAVDLVVELGVADEAHRVGEVDLVVEQGHGILAGLRVAVRDVGGPESVVPPEVSVESVLRIVIYVLGGVHADRRSDGVLVREAVAYVHALSVEVDQQMLVEELGAEVQRQGLAVELGSLEGSVLARHAEGDAPRHREHLAAAHVAGNGHIAVDALAELEDLSLPVGVGVTESLVCFSICPPPYTMP